MFCVSSSAVGTIQTPTRLLSSERLKMSPTIAHCISEIVQIQLHIFHHKSHLSLIKGAVVSVP